MGLRGAERGEVVKGAEEAIGADWDIRAEGFNLDFMEMSSFLVFMVRSW